MRIRIGTSGFSYKEWKGNFYPEDLPASEMLRFYSGRFSTVEINNTFYRMPRPPCSSGWAEQVPDGFTFALKASQRITHRARLKDADDSVEFFSASRRRWADRLGPVLFQLPPNLKKDLPRLQEFLAAAAGRSTRRVRVPPRVLVRRRGVRRVRASGAALCIAEAEDLATPLVATAGGAICACAARTMGPRPSASGRGDPRAALERCVRLLQARGRGPWAALCRRHFEYSRGMMLFMSSRGTRCPCYIRPL